MEVCGGLPCVCQSLDSRELRAKTVTASAFGWNGGGITEQCPWPKELFRVTAFGKARRCDRGPHVSEQINFHITLVVCWKTILKSGKRAVQRSLWLCVI